MRIGAKKRPFYRIVAVDERKKRTGSYLELLGTYNPLTEPKEIIFDQAKVDDWVKKGAQLSHGMLRILGQAPQKPPRKAKKEKKESSEKSVVSSQTEDIKEEITNDEVLAEEAPVEEAQEAERAEDLKDSQLSEEGDISSTPNVTGSEQSEESELENPENQGEQSKPEAEAAPEEAPAEVVK